MKIQTFFISIFSISCLIELKFFKQILKISAFYLENQKSFIPKKI